MKGVAMIVANANDANMCTIVFMYTQSDQADRDRLHYG